jgi:beta-lactamase regulating signal transducer with metallopeptidase domain
MNSIGMALVWCVIQVTLTAAITALAYGIIRRFGPPARAQAVLCGLLVMGGLTACAFSSWPRWNLSGLSATATTGAAEAKLAAVEVTEVTAPDAEKAIDPSGGGRKPSQPADAISPTAAFFKTLFEEMQKRPPIEQHKWQWPAYVAMLFAIGLAIGVIRLVMGLAAVRSYRLRATPISDPRVQELADVLLAELRGPNSVSVRESRLLSTPATIGWRRPLIILPVDWPEWSEAECRVVLAHEIAHIARRDYATWIAAQLALVFHFYHPLVHWLAARLRLEQELAADASAARVVGGQQSYLMTLAGMALRRSDQPLAWPARTFLPTRGTLMRRIEMLRDEKLHVHEVTARFRAVLIAGLAIVGLGVAGLRGRAAEENPPTGGSKVLAAQGDQPDSGGQPESPPESTRIKPEKRVRTTGTTGSSSSSTSGSSGSSGTSTGSTSSGWDDNAIGAVDPDSLAWVPRDAMAVVRVRPRDLLNRPALASFKKTLFENKELNAQIGVPFDRFEQVTVVLFPPGQSNPRSFEIAATILRLSTAGDATNLMKALHPNGEVQEFSGQKFVTGGLQRPGGSFLPDERTVVFCGREDYLRRIIVAGKPGATKAKWAEAWKQTPATDVVGLLNILALREILEQEVVGAHGGHPIHAVAPLWRDCSTAILTAEVSKQSTLNLELTATNGPAAAKVQNTLSALVTLSQNSLSQFRAKASQLSGEQAAMSLRMADMADSFLDTIKITPSGKSTPLGVPVKATASVDAEQMAAISAALAPALETARGSAKQAVSMNNLKQLALAMHNYYEVNQSFPPAVLYGPDGKTPYSWRVALLPFVDQAQLYEQYKKDEPWDGPNNKKLIDKMPSVFRDPVEPDSSQASSYFAVVGPTALFSGKKEGTKMIEITDGTSNTLMLVEAKRDIPWTKPEDIPYGKDHPSPKLGGHYPSVFIGALADGSVRIFSDKLPEDLLRVLLTRDGGEPINLSDPRYQPDPAPRGTRP